MIELDVQLTRDARLVVFHDERLERTTNGTGRLAHMRYRDLARLDSGTWFHPRFADQHPLLLSQAVSLMRRPMRMNLELKHSPRKAMLVGLLLRLIRRHRIDSRVLVSSLEPALLRPLASTRLAFALICRRQPDLGLSEAIRLCCLAWHPFHELVTPGRIQRAHRAGLRVHAWTVDEPKRARQLVRWGIDGLFTNDPVRLVGYVT